MEDDDDEFGCLYTDVAQVQPSPFILPPSLPPKSPIDLNLPTHDQENDGVFPLGPLPNPDPNSALGHHNQILPPSSESNRNSYLEAVRDEGLADVTSSQSRVFGRVGKDDFLAVETNECLDDGASRESRFSARGGKDDSLAVGKEEDLIGKEDHFDRFDIEDAEEEEETVIPGVSVSDRRGGGRDGNNDFEESESDDDLKIVLNESKHDGMVVEGLGDEDDDDPLVIVADSDLGNGRMEEREWAEGVADVERKEVGEGVKANGGGTVVAPKIGFNNNFTYQPYHSLFKYVRPGTAPVAGSVPVALAGSQGQVRPPVNMSPIGGFGRGDWRPTGIRNAYVWGNNTAGRGFGSGLDFTLPSHKTIFEVDVDSFEEKPWRLAGLDMSDFFNFGLNEETWKDYCKQLEQLRLETTMQSKIRVYESGRTEQDYDPDLPPELAAAAVGRDTSSENASIAKLDGGQINVSKGSQDVRPPLPIGRAIQVETSTVERLPSTDTRPLRIRDPDVIIEIVLQHSTDDASSPGNDVTEQPENEPLRECVRGGQETKGDSIEQQSGGRKREIVGRRAPIMNSIHDNMIEGESLLLPRPDSREHSFSYPRTDVGTLHEERQAKRKAHDRSPIMTHSGSPLDKGVLDNQKVDSVESSGGKQSNQLSSPATVGSAEEADVVSRDGLHQSSVMSDGQMALDRTTFTDTCTSGSPLPSVKKQKLGSRVEQSSDQEMDNERDIKAARSGESSKARCNSSRDYHKFPDSVDEEVVQDGHSTRMGNLKRPLSEDAHRVRRKRHEVESHCMVEKEWEDSHSRPDLDPHLAHRSHMKTEGIDRRKGRENSEGVRQQRDDDPHRGRARAEETRNKVRERERMDKDEHLQIRKQLDKGNSWGYHHKDAGTRPRERDDDLKRQYENMNDHYAKRRKEEDYSRRDGEKEEILHRANLSRHKRERDGALDPRKRDDQVRTREDSYHSVRYKEDDGIHRERDQMHRTKQSHEESLLKRETEERREGLRKSGRAAEEKLWVPHGRVKDEYKGTSDRNYQFKETRRHNEQLTRRVEDGSLSQHRGHDNFHSTRGSQHNEDARRSRQEREGTWRDIVGGGSDNNRHEKKRKASTRSKDSMGGDSNSVGPLTRSQEDQSGHMNELAMLKGTTKQGIHNEGASSDDEQRNSRRGRSKLERWTSHKDRDFNSNSKSSSSSVKVKEIDLCKNGASKLPEESSKTIETNDGQHPLSDQRDQNDGKSVNGRHSDTAAKLKQRSERFKLPMPNDKEAAVVKKMEGEPLLPSAQSGANEDPEIKLERPPRKRRWISN